MQALAACKHSPTKTLGNFLQALADGVKKEVRQALAAGSVSKFVIKPVKRGYAFELASIPRQDQWVLKVKYPANYPHLKLGLTGPRCFTS